MRSAAVEARNFVICSADQHAISGVTTFGGSASSATLRATMPHFVAFAECPVQDHVQDPHRAGREATLAVTPTAGERVCVEAVQGIRSEFAELDVTELRDDVRVDVRLVHRAVVGRRCS